MKSAIVFVLLASTLSASQQPEQATPYGGKTSRPVIRGRRAAVSSMRQAATEAARRILQAGGNAFDAAVAGQAVLGLADPADNGVWQ